MRRDGRSSARGAGRFDVAVVGAGPVGASCARALALQGAQVAVIEAGDRWGSACADASAGWVCPSLSGPFAGRDDLWQGLRWLLRRDSPLAIAPTPGLLLWLTRLLHGTGRRAAARCVEVLRELSQRSIQLHSEFAREDGYGAFQARGLLDVYTTATGYEAGLRRADAHAAAVALDVAEARQLEPALGPGIAGAVLYPAEADCEPSRFVAATGEAAERAGAVLLDARRALSLEAGPGGASVCTTAGRIDADRVIIAAGVATAALVRPFARVPLRAGKGYAVDVPVNSNAPALDRPMYLHEQRVAVTPWSGKVRFAGTLELGGQPGIIDGARVAGIMRAAGAALPGPAAASSQGVVAGLRPCTPDGLPAVGPVDEAGRIHVATGHAMLGVTLAPVTAELLGGLLCGSKDDPLLAALAPRRFASISNVVRRMKRTMRRPEGSR